MLTSPGERRRVVSVREVAGGTPGGRGPGGAARPRVPGTLGSRRWARLGTRGRGPHPCFTHHFRSPGGGLQGTWQDKGSWVSLLQGSSQLCPCCLPASRAPLPSTSASSALWCHLRSPRLAPPGCPRCPQASEPAPLPPSAPPPVALSTLPIFLVFLSLASLPPPVH